MGVFHELDPELHLKLVEGYEDELSSEAKALDSFYRMQGSCKRCGGQLRKEYNGRQSFASGDILPRALLRCDNCGFLLEPFSGIVVYEGNPGKVPMSIIDVVEK